MTDEEMKERYEDTAEFKNAMKELPQAIKLERVKGVSLLEIGYRIGLAEGQKEATA